MSPTSSDVAARIHPPNFEKSSDFMSEVLYSHTEPAPRHPTTRRAAAAAPGPGNADGAVAGGDEREENRGGEVGGVGSEEGEGGGLRLSINPAATTGGGSAASGGRRTGVRPQSAPSSRGSAERVATVTNALPQRPRHRSAGVRRPVAVRDVGQPSPGAGGVSTWELELTVNPQANDKTTLVYSDAPPRAGGGGAGGGMGRAGSAFGRPGGGDAKPKVSDERGLLSPAAADGEVGARGGNRVASQRPTSPPPKPHLRTRSAPATRR